MASLPMSSTLYAHTLQVPYFLSSASLVNRRQKLPLPDLSMTYCKFSSDASWLCVSLAIHRKEGFTFLPSGETCDFSWVRIYFQRATWNQSCWVMGKGLFFDTWRIFLKIHWWVISRVLTILCLCLKDFSSLAFTGVVKTTMTVPPPSVIADRPREHWAAVNTNRAELLAQPLCLSEGYSAPGLVLDSNFDPETIPKSACKIQADLEVWPWVSKAYR